MGGRLLRPKTDGSKGIMIDCCGWTEEFGTLNSPKEWSLDPEIDPNDPRKKNRIVGKDKDGNFTTDLDQMAEFTELIEMTPEEYIGRVKGGLETAKKQNLTIDEKIKMVENDLAELLHKAALKGLKEKVSPFSCLIRSDKFDKEELIAYFFHDVRGCKEEVFNKELGIHEQIDSWQSGSHVVEMNLKRRNLMYASLSDNTLCNDYYARRNEHSLKQYREMSGVCGEVNRMIVDNNNLMMQILEKHQQIHDLRLSKINLAEYKDLQKKFEQDSWKQTVVDHFKTGNEFMFSTHLDENDYFKGGDPWQKIEGIIIPAGQINGYHNQIVLKMVTNSRWSDHPSHITKEKKYVKGEKVWELLEQGKWQKPE